MSDQRPRLIGRFEIVTTLACGATTTVEAALSEGAGGFQRLVAVKHLHAPLAADPEAVERFVDQARTAGLLRHANVVSVLELTRSADGLCAVMDYVEGASLAWLLADCRRRSSPFPLGVALRILLDALAGLGCAHALTDAEGTALGLVHGNLSSKKILVGVDGVGRVVGFSPVAGDPRDDVHALGVIAEALVGGGVASTALARVIARARCSRPSGRFATVRAFSHAIVRSVPPHLIAHPEAVGSYIDGVAREVLAARRENVRDALRRRAELTALSSDVVYSHHSCASSLGGPLCEALPADTIPTATIVPPDDPPTRRHVPGRQGGSQRGFAL